MTELLRKAFLEASRLPQEEQDELATVLLEEIAGGRRWTDVLGERARELGHLAEEPLVEYRAGETPPLDSDDA